MEKPISITTFQNAYNYGAILQGFALQNMLTKLGYKVETLNYLNKTIGNQYQPTYFRNLKDGRKVFIQRKQRAINFEKFIAENMKLTEGYNKKQIKQMNWQHYTLITGSDQVWNPKITDGLDDIYTLNFGNSAKKISYAASVGNISNIENHEKEYKEIISRLDAISVREEDAKQKLCEITSANITTVLDPTLLLTRKEWEEVVKDLPKNEEKYICAYVVEPNEEYVKIVNDLSEKTGLAVVHFGIKNPGYQNVLKSAYTEGPLEFINYIKNAEYVVTTSFHATIFSILFQKRFFVVPHEETGARVTNLLDKLQLKGRVFYQYQEFQEINYQEQTDWTSIEENLETERQESIKWLTEAIEK